MKTKYLAVLIFSVYCNVFAQVPNQEQLQAADTQLNQVYQQIKGSLNDAQKQQLKLDQRDWIKKRDAFVTANPGNPQGALYQATMQRVGALKGVITQLNQSSGTQTSSSSSVESPRKLQQGNLQTVSQEECQQADDQLNQVYKQLIEALNEDKKKQLKMGQLDWIKKRDIFVAANPGNTLEAMYQATQERIMILKSFTNSANNRLYMSDEEIGNQESKLLNTIGELRQYLDVTQKQKLDDIQKKWMQNQEASIASKKKWNESHLNRLEAMVNPKSAYYYALIERIKEIEAKLQNIKLSTRKVDQKDDNQKSKISPIYQEVSWNNLNVVAEVSGSKYRAVSIVGDNKIYVFDVMSKLLYGVIEMSNGAFTELDPARFLCFSGDQRFLYSVKNSLKGMAYQFYEIPSLLFVYGNETYKSDIDGPYLDENKNLGVCVIRTGENLPTTCYFRSAAQNELQNEFDLLSTESKSNTEYFKTHPEMATRIGEFKRVDDSRDVTPVKKLYLDKEGIFKSDPQKADNNVFEEVKSEKTIALNINKNSISLHQINDSEKSTIKINIADLSYQIENWSGPNIIKNPLLNGSLKGPYTGYGFENVDQKNGIVEGVKYNAIPTSNGLTMSLQFKKDTQSFLIQPKLEKKYNPYSKQDYFSFSDSSGKENMQFANTLQAYCYTNPVDVTVGYWVFPEKYGAEYELGIFNNDLRKWVQIQNNDRVGRSTSEIPSHYWDDQNGEMWLCSSNSISKIDLNTGSMLQTFNIGKKYEVFALSDERIFGMPRMDEKRGEIWNRDPLKKVCDILWADDGNIMIYNKDGYYATKAKCFKSIAAKSGDRVYPFEQFDLKLNRPDIICSDLGFPNDYIATLKTLREKRLKHMGVTEEMLQPDFHLPELQIVGEVPATTPKDQLDLQIKATDDKYPLDRLRVYVNNVPVNGRDGELLRDQKTQSFEKTIPIKLAAGRNKIQISVLNSAGAESFYANAEVNCTSDRPKPKLYAVALGVSQYDRPEWCLKYAAKDATDLIGKLKVKARSSYSEVKPLLLTDKEVTKESTAKIKEFLSTATIDDTVLIFMAGHGLLDDKYDYYFGTTDIDPAKPSERGMPYEAIDSILAEVPSLKKALLMDTCHAGELDDDEKKDLAASDGSATPPSIPPAATNSSPLAGKVAMRSIGTRGMTVKAVQGAKGKSDWYEKLQDMFVDLRRGSGATVISSSQGAEYAFESSEQSNGLFTYALMEALDGKATPNKDGQITISSIGDYVKKRVQDLTKGKQNPNLRGVNLEEDFTLSSTK